MLVGWVDEELTRVLSGEIMDLPVMTSRIYKYGRVSFHLIFINQSIENNVTLFARNLDDPKNRIVDNLRLLTWREFPWKSVGLVCCDCGLLESQPVIFTKIRTFFLDTI